MKTEMFTKPLAQTVLCLSHQAELSGKFNFSFIRKSTISFCRTTTLSRGDTWRSNSVEEADSWQIFFIFNFRGLSYGIASSVVVLQSAARRWRSLGVAKPQLSAIVFFLSYCSVFAGKTGTFTRRVNQWLQYAYSIQF